MKADSSVTVLNWAVAALLAVLAVSALLLHWNLMLRLGTDGENCMDESEPLCKLVAARAGEPVYRDFTNPPHVMAAYMPLFYVVPGVIAQCCGTGTLRTILVGRLYVYVLWLGVAGWVFALARQRGCARRFAAVGALLWMASGLATENAVAYRPDAAAIFFSLGGLWLWGRGERPVNRAGAVALLAAGFLHRHAAVAALAAIIVDELARRRVSLAAAAAGGWLVAVGGVVLVMQAMTNGAFAQNVFGLLSLRAESGRFPLLFGLALMRGVPGLLACVLAFGLVREERFRLLAVYGAASLAVAFGSSWKFGSGINYFLEPFAAGCALAPVLLQRASQRSSWGTLAWLVLAIVASVQLLVARVGGADDLHGAGRWRIDSAQQWDELLTCIGPHREPMLIEDGYLALRVGGKPFLINASMLSALQAGGKFDDGPVIERIKSEEFSAILATQPLEGTDGFRHFPAHWRDEMRAHYTLAKRCRLGRDGSAVYLYLPAVSRSAK